MISVYPSRETEELSAETQPSETPRETRSLNKKEIDFTSHKGKFLGLAYGKERNEARVQT
jgi:hypothetical protein